MNQKTEADSTVGEKHLLENKWTLWYDPGENKKQNWGDTLTPVFSFDSVEDFWCLINNIKQPSSTSKADFHLFKKGIEPKWEDPVCAPGGKWNISMKSNVNVDQLWLNLLLACIGEHFTEGDDICGAVVSLRHTNFRIGLWTKTANNESIQVEKSERIRTILIHIAIVILFPTLYLVKSIIRYCFAICFVFANQLILFLSDESWKAAKQCLVLGEWDET